MDEIVGKCETFVEILQLSVSPRVKLLSKDKFSRAFQWAEYCQKVHSKVKVNPAVCEQLNMKLKRVITNKCMHLGDFSFSIDALRDAPLLLYQNFLSNPDLPVEFLPLLQEKFDSIAGEGTQHTFVEDLVNIIQQRASFDLIERLHHNVEEISRENEITNEDEMGTDIITAAQLMRKHIEMNMEHTGEKWTEFILSTFNATSSNPKCVIVILQSLLATSSHLPKPVDETSDYYTCAISWLKSKANVDREVARLPRSLVRDLVPKYFEFYRMYLDALAKMAESPVSEASCSTSATRTLTCAHVRLRVEDLIHHKSEQVRKVARAKVDSSAGVALKEILKEAIK